MHQEVKFMLKAAFMALIAATLLLWIFCNKLLAESLLIGGLVSIIPHFAFAKVFFYYQGVKKHKQIMQLFYLGEGLKLLLTALLFAVAFTVFTLKISVFFTGFVGMIILQIGLSLCAGRIKETK